MARQSREDKNTRISIVASMELLQQNSVNTNKLQQASKASNLTVLEKQIIILLLLQASKLTVLEKQIQ